MSHEHSHGRTDLTRYAWLSIAAACVTIALKFAAYELTGSVGLLSDAAESVVNLVAGFVALVALHVASRPADESHPFGHSKAEYFSAAVEGIMIFVAAVFIIISAVERFLNPQPLENLDIGLVISIVATVINGAVATVLIRAGRKHRSLTLTADGKHLLTDVWTTVGVVIAVVLVSATNWLRLDPIIAFLVGCNIIWAGWGLVRESVDGLMDRALPPDEHAEIEKVLAEFASDEVHFHAVRTRSAGATRFISMHVLVPGAWSVQRGHDLLEQVEHELRETVGTCEVDTHLEPSDDPRSYEGGPGATVGAPPL